MVKPEPKNFLISRTDAIGDIVLTLPMAGVLKKYFPGSKVLFFGSTYTEAVIRTSKHVDAFINYDLFLKSGNRQEFLKNLEVDTVIHVFPRKQIAVAAKQAGIANRIGTTHRFFHWLNCNYKVALGRKNSDLHEAQLNLKLLQPLGIKNDFSQTEIFSFYGMEKIKPLREDFEKLLDNSKFNLILHPKSHSSAREWGLENFEALLQQLPPYKFRVFITGSEKEKKSLTGFIQKTGSLATDLTGQMNLEELISFINRCDGLIAASTGPLHIAAAFNKYALGIYPPVRPQHPGRWAPIGPKAEFLVAEKTCNACRKNPSQCRCMQLVTAQMVLNKITSWKK